MMISLWYSNSMKNYRTIFSLAALAGALFLTGCASNPLNGEMGGVREVGNTSSLTGFFNYARNTWGREPATLQLPAPSDRPEVWIGNSLGEMVMYYAMADVALLGGSFKPLGGQNLIEAIACGCPVIMGPHTFNFEQAAREAQARGAALRVANMGEAVQAAVQAVTQPAKLQRLRQAGQNFSASYRGAAEGTAEVIAKVLARR